MTAAAEASLAGLRRILNGFERVVVAFSGGADSAFLAWVANEVLGPDRAHAVTAVSPSLGDEEAAHCRALARAWGLRWTTVATTEMDDPAYVANGADRCARCKSALMDALAPLAHASGATVVLGVNCDDLSDHRPGQE
ncbi:MAG: asparagine synthase-related protein, partial [Acidimicrobiales bacterium]